MIDFYDDQGSLIQPFYPPAVIYTNRGSKISDVTFTKNLFSTDFPLSLLVFDVTSQVVDLSASTKKDPHYSDSNGTYNLLRHDLSHYLQDWEIVNEIRFTKKLNIFDYYKRLGEIVSFLQNSTQEQNELKIFQSGLFILGHELSVIFNTKKNIYRLDSPLTFEELIKTIQNIMIENIIHSEGEKSGSWSAKGRNRYYYKFFFRDHEFILKNKHDLSPDKKPYLPEKEVFNKLSLEEKEEAVKDGYQRFWDDFLKIYFRYNIIPVT